MPQIFHPRINGLTRILLVGGALALLAVACVAYFLNRSPYLTGQGAVPEQPVPFSHEHHVGGLGIDCRYCHTAVDRSTFAGLPDTYTCMSCHSQLWTNAQMLAPVRESLKQDRPLVWVRVHKLPDFVYFNHQAHVTRGIGCESCHGRVDRMPLMRQAKPMTMQWCLDCHRHPAIALRPKDRITAMGYAPAGNGDALLHQYRIHTDRMTECVICHR
ncbi:cytochrome c3 family protein [Microbulbifer sp.]|uniref:cytochrome c3 family protein n=1 Tax=Microbulbifer sp. TaxID=1908541 RepID=UPI003F2A7B8C